MQKTLIPFLLLLATLNLYSQENESKTADGLIVSKTLFSREIKQGVRCFRIPALITAPNGDLLAVADERVPNCGDLRMNNNINIVMRRSSDNGKTWSHLKTLVDFPEGESASDPSLIVDKITGEIFLFYNYMDLKNEKNIYYLHRMKSSDNGLTWSEAVDITSQITKPEWKKDFKFITSGRGIQVESGELLHCLVNIQHGLHIFGSADHGKSWFLIDTPLKPGDESKIAELADGKWMVNSRVAKKGMRYVHISSDKGKTWQTRPQKQLRDPGCNASFIRYTLQKNGYSKNRLLFSNANSPDKRRNMTVRISYDEGSSWSSGKTIYEGPSAYSSLTILNNGDIGLLFEKDRNKEIVFVSFSLEWLTDGKDHIRKK